MNSRVNIITLGVKDVEVSRKFYERGLSLTVSSASQDDVVFFHMNGTILALYPWVKLAEDSRTAPEGHGFRGITLAQNVPVKSQVAEILAHAEAAGGRIVKPAQDVFWGGHSGYFADPDEHLWEIAWNPHFPLKDGHLLLP